MSLVNNRPLAENIHNADIGIVKSIKNLSLIKKTLKI